MLQESFFFLFLSISCLCLLSKVSTFAFNLDDYMLFSALWKSPKALTLWTMNHLVAHSWSVEQYQRVLSGEIWVRMRHLVRH